MSVWCPLSTTQELPNRRETSRSADSRFACTRAGVPRSNRAASPGWGVMTRTAFRGTGSSGSQSSALASTTTGSSASRHRCRVVVFSGSGISAAASPGPARMAL